MTWSAVVKGALALATLFDAALTVVHAIPAADETSDNQGEIEVRPPTRSLISADVLRCPDEHMSAAIERVLEERSSQL